MVPLLFWCAFVVTYAVFSRFLDNEDTTTHIEGSRSCDTTCRTGTGYLAFQCLLGTFFSIDGQLNIRLGEHPLRMKPCDSLSSEFIKLPLVSHYHLHVVRT